ncbi:MAG: inosine/xanthosine triphosphatase [Candidatus Jordarchaeum sp.]|uniref:inosine/xanthosine triphosphatase n=1 Tax=Candidatus Jordarchaeum sp. TaxID=2823881 RepID=UPI004049654B
MKVVAVGSENPVKISAVKNVMKKLLGNIKIHGVKVSSSTPPQPIGVSQTLKGALDRAINALNKVENADLGVGIEAGLIDIIFGEETRYLDFQYCVIVDKHGRKTIGVGPGFEYPPIVNQKVMKENFEVGEVMEKITGIEKLGEKMGAIGFLSHGLISRTKLTEFSVIMAMLPRINSKLYSKQL